MFEYFYAVYEHDRYIVAVSLSKVRVRVYIDLFDVEIELGAGREYIGFCLVAEMASGP